MSRMFADVQPAVKKETRKVAIGTLICVALMWAVFGIGHAVVPEKIPFDYTVFLAGAINWRYHRSAEFFPYGAYRTESGIHGGR